MLSIEFNRILFKIMAANDCIFCVYKLYLKYFRIIGLTSHTYKCIHTQYENTFDAKFAKTQSIIAVAIAIIMFITLLVDLQYTPYQLQDVFQIIIAITDHSALLTAALIILTVLSKSKTRMQELVGCQSIINEAKLFGFNNFISDAVCYKMRLFSVLYCQVILWLFAFNVCYIFYAFNESFYLIIKEIVSLARVYLDFGLIFTILSESIIYKHIFKRLYYYLEITLKVRGDYFDKRKVVKEYLFLNRLKTLIRLRGAVNFNVTRIYQNLVNPSALIWICNAIITLILHMYLILHALVTSNLSKLDMSYFIINFRVSITTTMVLLTLTYVREFEHAVSQFFLLNCVL